MGRSHPGRAPKEQLPAFPEENLLGRETGPCGLQAGCRYKPPGRGSRSCFQTFFPSGHSGGLHLPDPLKLAAAIGLVMNDTRAGVIRVTSEQKPRGPELGLSFRFIQSQHRDGMIISR